MTPVKTPQVFRNRTKLFSGLPRRIKRVAENVWKSRGMRGAELFDGHTVSHAHVGIHSKGITLKMRRKGGPLTRAAETSDETAEKTFYLNIYSKNSV